MWTASVALGNHAIVQMPVKHPGIIRMNNNMNLYNCTNISEQIQMILVNKWSHEPLKIAPPPPHTHTHIKKHKKTLDHVLSEFYDVIMQMWLSVSRVLEGYIQQAVHDNTYKWFIVLILQQV